jgi:hypothetical protein
MYPCPAKVPVVYEPLPGMPASVKEQVEKPKPTPAQVLATIQLRGDGPIKDNMQLPRVIGGDYSPTLVMSSLTADLAIPISNSSFGNASRFANWETERMEEKYTFAPPVLSTIPYTNRIARGRGQVRQDNQQIFSFWLASSTAARTRGPPPGAQVAVLSGDPAKPGALYTLCTKLPDGYKVPPHWHPTEENATVIQGVLLVGTGDKFDAAKLKEVPAGAFMRMPKEMRHFAQAKGESILQLHGIAPFEINYVNAADDPRKK